MKRIVRGVGTKPAARYARSSPGLTIATATSASTARAHRRSSGATRFPTASQTTADEYPRQTACVTTAQPPPSSSRRYSRGESLYRQVR